MSRVDRRYPGRRPHLQGVSLIETLVVMVIAIILLIIIYSFLTKSTQIADHSGKSIQLQQGARNLLENMVRDINAAHMWADAQPNTFTVLKYQFDKPEVVAAENVAKGHITYPFYKDGSVTKARVPVFKCSYLWKKEQEVVLRKITKGVLVMATPATGLANENILKYSDYSFVEQQPVAGEPAAGRVVATNVKKFDLTYFGYDDMADGLLKEASQVTALEAERKIARVAMVLVHFQALFDEGSYADKVRQPKIEVMTKIWSYKRINDHVYKEYFSSLDEDTRF